MLLATTLLLALATADSHKDPQLDYVQAGGRLFFYEWSCSTGREEGVRHEVQAALSQFVNSARLSNLMQEFNVELNRMGYGNRFVPRQCQIDRLKSARRGQNYYRRVLDRPDLWGSGLLPEPPEPESGT